MGASLQIVTHENRDYTSNPDKGSGLGPQHSIGTVSLSQTFAIITSSGDFRNLSIATAVSPAS